MSRVKFGDVVKDVKINIDRLNNPYEYYVAGDHMDSEDLTIHRKGCFTTDDVGPAFIRVFKPGQILYGSRRTYLKKIAVADFEGVCANTTFVFETKDPHAFEQRLLPFIMLSKDFTTWSIAKSKGSTNPYVLFSDLADFEFELPPLEEQKVLVDKLWAAYRLKEAYKKLLVATDEMVKSQFIEMFGNPLSLNQKNELKRLGECCILNPRRPNIALCDTDKVSFIPMPAVSEDGYLVDMTDEEYGKVKKGFTYFENNDVLFAKITPCMENGKGAIVHGLTNGIGMGSTEFHVLRPINGISSPYWLLALTRMPIFRERAAKNMSGTGGQKRVSASYLDHFMVGLPAIEEQRRFEAIYKQADKSKFGDFKSQFIEMFGTVENNTHNFPIMTIGEFANCFAGATPSTSHPEYWENGRIRWMSSGEVHKGHVEDTDFRITELGYKSASTRMVPIHSIVIAIAGQGKTRGTVAITEVDLCTNQSLCAIVPDERVNYLYLYHNLQGDISNLEVCLEMLMVEEVLT